MTTAFSARIRLTLLAALASGLSPLSFAAAPVCPMIEEPPSVEAGCGGKPNLPSNPPVRPQGGEALVEVTVAASGKLLSAHAVSASGFDGMDRFALQAVRGMCWGRYEEHGRASCYRVLIPVKVTVKDDGA